MKANVKLNNLYLIGIDEAGRGPLAGPVSVSAFAVRSKETLKKFRGVKDSKQLSEKQREEWFRLIKISVKNSEIFYSVSFAQAETIDGKGLSYAVYSALNRCLKKLEKKNFASPDSKILLDGSLYASSRYTNQKTIIDGDAKEKIIALASICAKVIRDRRMKKLAKEYPDYGFEIHKGYGTKGHYKAIRKHGMLPAVHRRSFLKAMLENNRRKSPTQHQ